MITLETARELAGGGAKTDAEAWRAWGLSRSGMGRFLHRAQQVVGLHGEVDVLLADDRTLRRLNRTFRGKNKATDVLSFPAAATVAGEHAGDLAISLDMATKQAEEHGHSLQDEVRVLMLHGLLHLSGMDHEVDDGEMARREAELRKTLRLPSGLIARVEGQTKTDSSAPTPSGKERPLGTPSPTPSGKERPLRTPAALRNGKLKGAVRKTVVRP